MISAIWVDALPQTAADPYAYGINYRAQQTTKQAGDPRYNTQAQSGEPPVFPVQRFAGGLKLALTRVWPSSVPGRPHGPPLINQGIIRGRRPAGTAPVTVERAIMPGSPGSTAQMASRRPMYESYLTQYEPFTAY